MELESSYNLLETHNVMFSLESEFSFGFAELGECTSLFVQYECMRSDSELLESEHTRSIWCECMRSHESNISDHICIFIGYDYIVSYIFVVVNHFIYFLWIGFHGLLPILPDMHHLRSDSDSISRKNTVRISMEFSRVSTSMRYWWVICGWGHSSHLASENKRSSSNSRRRNSHQQQSYSWWTSSLMRYMTGSRIDTQ